MVLAENLSSSIISPSVSVSPSSGVSSILTKVAKRVVSLSITLSSNDDESNIITNNNNNSNNNETTTTTTSMMGNSTSQTSICSGQGKHSHHHKGDNNQITKHTQNCKTEKMYHNYINNTSNNISTIANSQVQIATKEPTSSFADYFNTSNESLFPPWLPFAAWLAGLIIISLFTAFLVFRYLRPHPRHEYEELTETPIAPLSGEWRGNNNNTNNNNNNNNNNNSTNTSSGNPSRQRFLESRRAAAAAQHSYGTDNTGEN